ncbi:MAG TPA: hypothetical protein PLZ57_08645 [Pseudobdellovibrionaceae bacterium]|nr:hypothetical protein [Pseudobdellovibrionaceae bacterium]
MPRSQGEVEGSLPGFGRESHTEDSEAEMANIISNLWAILRSNFESSRRMHQLLLGALLITGGVFGEQTVAAKEVPAQGRVFAGLSQVKPTQFNDEMRAQGLKELTQAGMFGAEITFPMLKIFELGMSYTRRPLFLDEKDSVQSTEYEASLTQDAVFGVARVAFFKTPWLRADVFGAVGGANTSIKIKTATQDGELAKKEANDWFATLVTRAGASVGVGYNQVFFYVEGGYETNKVDSFKRTGNLNGNIQSLDLSGSYVSIGLMFDGVKATRN